MRDAEIEHTENPKDQPTKQKKPINSTSSVKCVMLKVNIPETQNIKQRNKKANRLNIKCKMRDAEIEHTENPKDQTTKQKKQINSTSNVKCMMLKVNIPKIPKMK